jgi:hypothetical protein
MSESESRICVWCETDLPDDWETARQHIANCLDAKRADAPQPVPGVLGLYYVARLPTGDTSTTSPSGRTPWATSPLRRCYAT